VDFFTCLFYICRLRRTGSISYRKMPDLGTALKILVYLMEVYYTPVVQIG
jgi:hypothetical protein